MKSRFFFFKFRTMENSSGLSCIHQGLSEPEFYGDLVYKFKNNVGRADFSDQFKKIIVRSKRIGYNINIMRQSACLVFNPITVNTLLPSFIARQWVGRRTQWWQHVVSVESLSLFHYSIYLWFICFPWWSIDELENLHADRTTMFWAMTEAEGEVGIP